MDNAMSMTRLPVTQLRPLHTHQQWTGATQPISWTSSVEPRPDEETAIKAFVKLVSHLVILDEGETFCIQDSKRGGFIFAQYSSSEKKEVDSFRFVKLENDQDIPSDFSIGEGKVSDIG
jgi:ferricrocin synthase